MDSWVLLSSADLCSLAKLVASKSCEVSGVLVSGNNRYLAQLGFGAGGLSCQNWREWLPTPFLLPGASHSEEQVRAKEKLQASQKLHHCLAHAHPPGV